MARTVLRSAGNVIVLSTFLTVASSRSASAAAITCETINAASAAGVMGVPKARANTPSPHHKMSPDNMDYFGCSYAEISPDPLSKTMSYGVYTPIPKDLATVFASVAHPNVPGKPTNFSPGIGTGSTGWFRLSANGETYDGSIVFQTGANIVEVKVGGMKSGDEAKNALIKAGNILAKP